LDWQGALLARIRDDAGVTALVAAKSYWEQAPQNTARPYVTLLDVTASRPQILKGFDLEASRVQIDVWTDKYSDKQAIMDAVIGALAPSKVRAGHRFQRADVALGPRDMPGERDGTSPIFRKSADLIFHHSTA
jgi:hypothetical protein